MVSNQSLADFIRSRTDEELADIILNYYDNSPDINFCQKKPECDYDLDLDRDIPLERCKVCLLEMLRQPMAERGGSNQD